VGEVERTIIYVAAIAAVLAAVTRETLPYLLAGMLAAIDALAIAALVERHPSPQPLTGPVGYWNALGILCAIGILLSLGLASTTLPRALRIGALAGLPVLATTLYLTHSRGALLGLGAALVLFAFFHPLLEGSRRTVAVALVLAAAAALVAAAIYAGGPTKLLGRTYGEFRSPAAPGGQPGQQLLTISGNFRSDYWRVAWRQYRGHPLLGTGAGTFDVYWTRDRHTIYGARDAHNLYLEALAELGPVGLLLLVGALAAPFFALRGAPRQPLTAAAAGGYLAFLVQAGVDWDWEIPAVTIAGLLCACALVIAADRPRPLPRAARPAALVALAVLAAFSLLAQVGNAAMQASQSAAERRQFTRAEERARLATRWNPWSSIAWRLKGEAELRLGYTPAARKSFLTGLDKDPREWRLWYDLARASRGADRRRALEQATRLNRYSREVRGLLGVQGSQ
jgi:hypothetical protein